MHTEIGVHRYDHQQQHYTQTDAYHSMTEEEELELIRRQTEELAQRNAELERFNRVMIGRERDMIALKQRVNERSRHLGQQSPHPLSFLDTPQAPPTEGNTL